MARQIINIQRIDIKLRIPMMDLHDSYDIFLKKGWFYVINAKIKYNKNQYKISQNKIKAKFQEYLYTQKKI